MKKPNRQTCFHLWILQNQTQFNAFTVPFICSTLLPDCHYGRFFPVTDRHSNSASKKRLSLTTQSTAELHFHSFSITWFYFLHGIYPYLKLFSLLSVSPCRMSTPCGQSAFFTEDQEQRQEHEAFNKYLLSD